MTEVYRHLREAGGRNRLQSGPQAVAMLPECFAQAWISGYGHLRKQLRPGGCLREAGVELSGQDRFEKETVGLL